MNFIKIIIAIMSIGYYQSIFASCYTIYDKNNNLIYQSKYTPVDLSKNIGDTLPIICKECHMIIITETNYSFIDNCYEINSDIEKNENFIKKDN